VRVNVKCRGEEKKRGGNRRRRGRSAPFLTDALEGGVGTRGGGEGGCLEFDEPASGGGEWEKGGIKGQGRHEVGASRPE